MPMTAPADWRSDPRAGLILVYGFSSSIIKAAKEKTHKVNCLNSVYTPVFERWHGGEPRSSRSPLTLITPDAFISRTAVACSSHIVTGSVVQALTKLLAAISKCTSRALCMRERCITTSIKIKALREWEPKCLYNIHTHTQSHSSTVISLRAKMCWPYSTLLTARPNEARSASALAIDVVTVCAILATADLGAVPAVKP